MSMIKECEAIMAMNEISAIRSIIESNDSLDAAIKIYKIWHKAISRAEYVYSECAVKNGQDVIDYLRSELSPILEKI